MRDLVELKKFWRDNAGQELAFCTLVGKQGSSYRAPGAKKIIIRDGRSCGLLSGGCLENDIIRLAQEGWTAMPFVKSFSTMSEEDRLLGYQTGCSGVIHVLFEHLPGNLADFDLWLPFGTIPKASGVAISLDIENLARREFFGVAQQKPDIFFDPWVQPIELVIVGCGPDAYAFAGLADQLGWMAHFLDYRQSRQEGDSCLNIRIVDSEAIAEAIPEGPNIAIVLMTHNYQADLSILARLAGKSFGYLGCIGPRLRYEQLLKDMAQAYNVPMPAAWEKLVYAPAGLLPKQRSPETIALSIIAQIQSVFGRETNGRSTLS